MAAIQSSVREMQYEETTGVAYLSVSQYTQCISLIKKACLYLQKTHVDDHEDNDKSFFAVLEV